MSSTTTTKSKSRPLVVFAALLLLLSPRPSSASGDGDGDFGRGGKRGRRVRSTTSEIPDVDDDGPPPQPASGKSGKRRDDRPYVLFAHTFNCDEDDDGGDYYHRHYEPYPSGGGGGGRRRRRRGVVAAKSAKGAKWSKGCKSEDETGHDGGGGSNGESESSTAATDGEVVVPAPSPSPPPPAESESSTTTATDGGVVVPAPSPPPPAESESSTTAPTDGGVVVPAPSPPPPAETTAATDEDEDDEDDDPRVAACDALAEGTTTTSDAAATLTYDYEVAIDPGSDLPTAIGALEAALSLYVGGRLMDCDDDDDDDDESTRGGRRNGRRRRGEATTTTTTTVVGVSERPVDEASSDGSSSCGYLVVGDGKVDDADCHVVGGGMTLFLGDGASAEDSEGATLEALRIIMEGMNDNDPSPFLEGSETEYSVNDVRGIRFIGGETMDGMTVEGEDGVDDVPNGQIEDAAAATVATKNVSTGAAVTLGLGLSLLALVAMALLAMRKRRLSTDERFREFKNEGGEDGEDLDTDLDDASATMSSPATTTTTKKKRAYVVGEEGSVRTFATHDTRILHDSHEVANDNGDDLRLDVHQCTSAICPVCNGKGLKFVSALDHGKDSSVSQEGVEFTVDDIHRRSFEYKPKEGASVPSYSNPAGIDVRPYIVDDTVDL